MAVVPDGGADLLAASGALEVEVAHEPGDGAAGHWYAFAMQLPPDFSDSVDAEVVRVDAADLRLQLRVTDCSGAGGAVPRRVVGARCDLQSVAGQDSADRLDSELLAVRIDERYEPVVGARCDLQSVAGQDSADRLDSELLAVRIDERYERFDGRSSSAAKKAEAALRISFARRSSAFSAFSRLISAASSEVTPGRRPASTSALRTQVRTVSAAPMPSLAATAFIAAHRGPRSVATIPKDLDILRTNSNPEIYLRDGRQLRSMAGISASTL